MDLSRFPTQPSSNRRTLYFEVLTEEDKADLISRGYNPVHLLSLPRVSEQDHKNYLMALTQGMAEGTIEANKSRLDAAELDLRTHGMLNKDVTHQQSDIDRDKTVEELIESFNEKSRHVLFTTTIQDPRVVEAFLLKEAGLLKPEEIELIKSRKKWSRKHAGKEDQE